MAHRAILQFDPEFDIGNKIEFCYDLVEPKREGFVHDVLIQYVYDGKKVRRVVESYTIRVETGGYFERVTKEEIQKFPPYTCMARVIPFYMAYGVGDIYEDKESGHCKVLSYYIEGKKHKDRRLTLTVYRYVQTSDNLIKKVREYERGVTEDGS